MSKRLIATAVLAINIKLQSILEFLEGPTKVKLNKVIISKINKKKTHTLTSHMTFRQNSEGE